MSILKVDTIQKADGTGSLSVPAESGTVVTTASPSLGRRNLVINGAMQVAQRGTSFTGASTGYTLDKWRFEKTATDQLVADITQDSDAPVGFSSSLKYTTTTTETALDADDFVNFQQRFEGQDLTSLGMNVSGAKQFTVSFWVKSSVTGTYGLWFYVADSNANIGSTYTVNTANTWEYKTVTFAANTSSGTCNYDNTLGGLLQFTLAAGSNYTSADNTSWNTTTGTTIKGYGHTAALITTASSTWQITGVQLEVGSVATPFEHRSFGEELALCQRYYQKSYDYGTAIGTTSTTVGLIATGGHQGSVTTAFIEGGIVFPVPLRASPTVVFYDEAGNSGKCTRLSTGVGRTSNQGVSTTASEKTLVFFSSGSASANIVTGYYTADAEL